MGKIENMKEPKYRIGVDAVYERPTAVLYYLRYYKRHGKASITPLTDGARREMEAWIAVNKKRIENMCQELNVDVPDEITLDP